MDHLTTIQTFLTQEEQEQLADWKQNKNKPSIAVILSLKMFELFLNGSSCEEIASLNDNQYTIGQILEARIRDKWDERREKYLNDLYGGIVDKVRQVQMESVAFTADLLAAAHKQFSPKLKKFMQDGDEKKIEDIGISGLAAYQKAVDIMMKLTGQDKKDSSSKLVTGTIPTTAVMIQGAAAPEKKLLPGGTENLESSLAEKVLKLLED